MVVVVVVGSNVYFRYGGSCRDTVVITLTSDFLTRRRSSSYNAASI